MQVVSEDVCREGERLTALARVHAASLEALCPTAPHQIVTDSKDFRLFAAEMAAPSGARELLGMTSGLLTMHPVGCPLWKPKEQQSARFRMLAGKRLSAWLADINFWEDWALKNMVAMADDQAGWTRARNLREVFRAARLSRLAVGSEGASHKPMELPRFPDQRYLQRSLAWEIHMRTMARLPISFEETKLTAVHRVSTFLLEGHDLRIPNTVCIVCNKEGHFDKMGPLYAGGTPKRARQRGGTRGGQSGDDSAGTPVAKAQKKSDGGNPKSGKSQGN